MTNVKMGHVLSFDIHRGIFFINYYLNQLTAEQRADYESKTLSDKSKWIDEHLFSFLEKVAYTDKSLSIYIELYKLSVLVIQCWESQRNANYDMYIHSIKETLPYLFALIGIIISRVL